MQINLTQAEEAELAVIYQFMIKLNDASNEELYGLALDEMDKKQPALQNLGRFLYQTKKFSMEQLWQITRLLILVWWYYKPWLKDQTKKIDDPLYVEMRKKWEVFEGKMKGKSRVDNKRMMDEMLKKYPARLLYGQIHRTIFMEKGSSFYTLSKPDKTYLLIHFKIIMDCFEALADRSIGSFNLN